MKWSWKIGEYKGIGVYIHATFVLIIIWVGYGEWAQSKNLPETVLGILFVLALFACVLLHEFGHALTAQKYGIRTRDITLLPIGGVARLERMPEDPRQELWVALAGPAVNVVIALVIYFWLTFTAVIPPLASLNMMSGSFLQRLMVVNIFLVLFNMIPAFPMDGGRVLRSLLALRMDYHRATHIAAVLGQAIAFLFALVGFFYNPFLIFIALFVWIGAAQESGMMQMRSAFHGISVDSAMITDFYTLQTNDPLARAMELTIQGSQQDFPVMENERVVGILTRKQLMTALSQHGPDYPVAKAMEIDFEIAESGEMLQTAFARLQNCNCFTMPVLKHGRLAGLLTMENIGEFMMIQSALAKVGR